MFCSRISVCIATGFLTHSTAYANFEREAVMHTKWGKKYDMSYADSYSLVLIAMIVVLGTNLNIPT